MIRSFRNKGLEAFSTQGDPSKLPVENHARIRRILALLDAATAPDDMNLPGYYFHGLAGKPKRFSVRATGNYRVTFAWEEGDAVALDIEDYHKG